MKIKHQQPGIGLIGLSHKTASVEIRENFSIDENKFNILVEKSGKKGIKEIVCLSTCNRMEIYFSSDDLAYAMEVIISIIADLCIPGRNDLDVILYKKFNRDAVLHLFSVASSLDSMVLGENEIIGQVKDAYRRSAAIKKTGIILNRLFHQSFASAKHIRNETEIAKSPISIAYIAVELAKSIFDDLTRRSALLIGAGEMGELILKYLTKNDIHSITIANRSYHNARAIAEAINKNAAVVNLDEIKEAADKADIIITSVSSNEFIIKKELIQDIVKKRKSIPLIIIDIAVPRNIDPDAGKINNVFLYNIDDLQGIADKNLKSRINEVDFARTLIESDADKFINWYDSLSIVPAIINMQNKFDDIREKEFNKYKKRSLKHLSDNDLLIVENLTKQIMTKTLHDPIMCLKSFHECDEIEENKIRESLAIIERLFGKHK